jgi:hypothetical protein
MSRYESFAVLSTMDSAYSIKWNRLFRGSEHEFSAAAFHRLCYNKGLTIVLIKAKNGLIGAGYCCVSWKCGNTAEVNPRGFLCSIDENDLSLQIFKGGQGECKIYQATNYGPIFLGGVCISNKCDKNVSSYSKLGGGFESKGDLFALFGTEYFTVVEYEVFGIEVY